MRSARRLLLLSCASAAMAACVTEFDLDVPGGTPSPFPSPSATVATCATLATTVATVQSSIVFTSTRNTSPCSILVSTSASACSFTLKQPFASTTLQPGSSLFLHQAQDKIGAADVGAGLPLDLSTVGSDVGRFQVITLSEVRANANGQTVVVADGHVPATLFSTTGGRVAQACLFPVYAAALLNSGVALGAEAWSDTAGGGVLAFRADEFSMAGTIDVGGAGFPGGRVGPAPADANVLSQTDLTQPPEWGGGRGGSIDSRSNDSSGWGRGTLGNGGGGGNSVRSGGGGGSNAGAGGIGGYEAPVASANTMIYGYGAGAMVQVLSSSESPRLLLGGGGGAGHHNAITIAARGGSGGGIVYLDLGTFTGDGLISASGGAGETGRTLRNAPRLGAAAGGGGGGGSVRIEADDASIFTGKAFATGGRGGFVDMASLTQDGTTPAEQGTGGGGGGGRIAILTLSSAQAYVSGGVAGFLTDTLGTRGALPGSTGVVIE